MGGGTAGTFEANAPLTVTASVTGEHEVEAEQYKLTITKGTGVASTTPAAGEHWLDKGTTQEVTATYSTGYQADSGTGSYTMDSAKTANVTAKKITYSVTYNYNCPSGATNNGGSTASQTKTYGESLTLMDNGFKVPSKATDTSYTTSGGKRYKKTYAYAFNGWNTAANGSGTAYAAKAAYTGNAALTLYAQWKLTTGESGTQYLLTITKGTGVASTTPTAGEHWLDKGTTQNVTATYSTGYQADSGTGSYTMDSAKTANVTAKKITYAVTYNYNCPSGATNNGGSTASQTKTYGESLTLMDNGFKVPSKATDTSYTTSGGKRYKKTYVYAFNGWNTAANGSGTAYAAKAAYTGNAALTLYAQWKLTTGESGTQYLLTISKGTGVSTVTVKVGSTTISPVSGTTTYWIGNGKTAAISATYNSGYVADSGTGNCAISGAAKTVNVKAKLDEYTLGYILKWTSALSQYGSYINSTSPASSTTNNYGWKQIKYTKPDGTTAVANPYSSGNIAIKKGSTVYLQMYAGPHTANSGVGWHNANGSITATFGNSSTLISYNLLFSSSATISVETDSCLVGGRSYSWYLEYS